MTATIIELDQQLLEDLVPPCEVGYIDHPEPPPADWIIHWACPCPPAHAFACTGCKDAFLGFRSQDLVWCEDCTTCFRPPQTAARLIEPLNRRPA